MVKSWEEEFWLISSILNGVLGLAPYPQEKIFSSWLPALPVFATVASRPMLTVLVTFSSSCRHENYFTTKPKILQSICLEIITVSLSEVDVFLGRHTKWLALFAWLAYSIPAVWATLRRPCHIPQYVMISTNRPILEIGGFVLWGFWSGNDDGHISQVAIGLHLLGQASELFVYHLYLEAERHMRNPEYYSWLLEQIRRGAIGRSQMLADLFLARGVYLPPVI
ncbi:hypothetical protein Salat_1310000 [Sesamum alatum]|uniref:Uncharacterized protein n=1 Tax=Sesamum alatum TaxID=300844 RepID=A0AAE1YIG4_9LAMI|nr:hypothetical protein Salat_1310000 [Sesamum alatum]